MEFAEKIWKESIREISEVDFLNKVNKLALELGISKKLCSLLVQRKIDTYEEAFRFFRPNKTYLIDPLLMKGMEKAIQRIESAIENHEIILLYGDYDVDGTTAVALFYRFLSSFYQKVIYYLPDREKEGYGISQTGIDFAQEMKTKLIIALDCGIKSIKEVTYAKNLEIDFIICDHHIPDENLPEALAILNPKQGDCPYPFKFLSGCGIAFKLAQAYQQKHTWIPIKLEKLLDLLTLSIACDMVEIVDENRILAYLGLIKLRQEPLTGLKALLECLEGKSENKNLGFQEILFQIGPRINAAGRMGDAHRVIELLTTEDAQIAKGISLELNQENIKRKGIEKEIILEALSMKKVELEEAHQKESIPSSTVLFHPSWHKGLIGIVASRMIEKYYAPTIIFTESRGKISGSARSIEGFNIYEALCECQSHLETFGGHAAAAGMTLKPENLLSFKVDFEKTVSKNLSKSNRIRTLFFEEELNLEDITASFYRILDQFSPFGPGNPRPVFLTRKIQILGSPLKIKGEHIKFRIGIESQKTIECIGFGWAEFLDLLVPEKPFDILYQIGLNTFKGNSHLQLLLKDIKPS